MIIKNKINKNLNRRVNDNVSKTRYLSTVIYDMKKELVNKKKNKR